MYIFKTLVLLYMLLFTSGSNTFYLAVEENRTLPTAYYLFVFVNDHTNKKVACYCAETEVDGIRSEFTCTVQTSPTALDGEIDITDLGFYHFYVYEKTLAEINAFNYSTIDSVDLRTMTGLVKNGKMKLTETATGNEYYKDYSGSVKVYNG